MRRRAGSRIDVLNVPLLDANMYQNRNRLRINRLHCCSFWSIVLHVELGFLVGSRSHLRLQPGVRLGEICMAPVHRILIVDDEQPIRRLLSLTFESAGYAVKTAGSGRDAMALCTESCFDLVLSDVVMPEVDGHELARWIATHYPETRTALISGLDLGCRKCAYSPRCKLIAKPFLPDQALAFVTEVLAA